VTIQLKRIHKTFGAFVALEDVSFDVPSGSLTALLGPSGSGKSTLLRIIGGLESPDNGRVLLNDEDVTRATPQSRGVGFVFQHYAMFRYMSVWDNVAFGLKVRRVPAMQVRKRVADLLEMVELDGFGERYPSQLSGGQQQRVALARALAVEPSVLLLDEPFGALDARVKRELRAWLRRLQADLHVTSILVTHDQQEAMEVADRVVLIDHGRVQQVGGPLELYDRPANDFVMSFVGPVTRLDGTLLRPDELEIRRQRTDSQSRSGVVERVTRLGFEVRIDLRLETGERVWSQVSRGDLGRMALEAGMQVFVKPAPLVERAARA
jgi:sulfate transport system ATP-binding protein